MPGPPGATLLGLNDPIINESGIVAFSGYFSVPASTDVTGLWTIDPAGGIHEVVREKTLVPGIAGAQFGSLIGNFQMNDTNQIALLAPISEAGINSSNDIGLWATDEHGRLISIVREGDVIQVAPNDFRTVQSIDFSNYSIFNNALSAWTDNEDLVYTLHFTDSSAGIFVSPVPEPRTSVLLTLAVAGECVWRHRYQTLSSKLAQWRGRTNNNRY